MILWKHILDKLQEGIKIYLLTVIENSGSSPGRKGFKMMVGEDGFIYGSVGGGVMEYALVEEAQKLLQLEEQPFFIKRQIHRGKVRDGSGMICSGEQSVCFSPIYPNDIKIIRDLVFSLENGSSGTLQLTPTSVDFSDKSIHDSFIYSFHSDKEWEYKEHLGYRDTLYIIGGGHVGVAVSELFVKLRFQVIIFDNRENLNTLVDNQYAHQKHVVDYHAIHEYIPQGNNSYITIMTHKYTDDKIVLCNLIRRDYRYLGVLGSKAKLRTMWKAMKAEGYEKEELEHIHAPIGLSIKSETPEEIAVSIAAEIIQEKNRDRK